MKRKVKQGNGDSTDDTILLQSLNSSFVKYKGTGKIHPQQEHMCHQKKGAGSRKVKINKGFLTAQKRIGQREKKTSQSVELVYRDGLHKHKIFP